VNSALNGRARRAAVAVARDTSRRIHPPSRERIAISTGTEGVVWHCASVTDSQHKLAIKGRDVRYVRFWPTATSAIARPHAGYEGRAEMSGDVLIDANAGSSGEFHPEPLTDPDVTLSHHPVRAIA
jgi:hypothetical protein